MRQPTSVGIRRAKDANDQEPPFTRSKDDARNDRSQSAGDPVQRRARGDEIPKGTFEDARHRPREKLLDRQLIKGSKWPYRPKADCHISPELILALGGSGHSTCTCRPRPERSDAATTIVGVVSIKVGGLPCEARLNRQPGNKEQVGVEHVEPGKDQHQAAGDLQHSLRTPQARAALEPAHRRRTKDDRDGAANTES